MGDIKLFRFGENEAEELLPHPTVVEKELQQTVGKYLENFLGIRFLAHEFQTGRPQRGYIDTLGLDDNFCPVIIEYKRFNHVNVITQGLYYLDWLMNHKAEFEKLVKRKLGEENFNNIEFEGARLICMAAEFSRYDEIAIMQINRNIELIKYKFYENNLLLLELLNTSLQLYCGEASQAQETPANENIGMPASLQERIRNMTADIEELYFEVLTFSENLGEDVKIRFLKHYIALSRIKIFTCIQPMKNSLKLWLNLDPGDLPMETGFIRDVSCVGHHASGNIEIEVKDEESFKKAQPFIELAYQQN